MMRLAEPYFLLALLLVVPILFYSRKKGGRMRFSNIARLKELGAKAKLNPRFALKIMRISSLALFIVAMARPQSGKVFSEIDSQGVDIILAIDTSGSMQALDFKRQGKPVDRLSVVKEVVSEFVQKRPNDRLGLIVFGGEAFTQCPLTLDHGILLEFLKEVEIGMAGDATAIGSAIGTGVSRMKDLKSKEKILILLTDGRSNSGRIPPEKAAELAKTFGIKVYTVGVGTRGKAPFLQDTFFGKRYVYQKVEIDEGTLKSVAEKTGARYFRATDTEKLTEIYDEIDKLEKSEIKVKEYTEYKEVFHLALLPGLILLLLEILLSQTKFRKLP